MNYRETHYICKGDKRTDSIRIINQRAQKTATKRRKRTEVEAKYRNLQKIHESTKKGNKIYQTEILKLKHEDTAEEVMKNFNKIQISLVTDKEQQIQELNTILEKEQGMKIIMTKDNMQLKVQNQTLQTKMQENQEKYDENLKILCRAKEEFKNLNKEKNSNLKDYLQKKIIHSGHIRCIKHK